MNIRYKFVLYIALILTQGCNANIKNTQLIEQRLKIKNYGISYCMRENTAVKNSKAHFEYSQAEGAYFNTGSHSVKSYDRVRAFIDSNYKQSNFKDYEGDNTFFSCLNIYNSDNYNRFIKSLDYEIYE